MSFAMDTDIKTILLVLDLFGTAVFAITGALAAIEKKLDLFGLLVLAFITAIGGGTIRDAMMNALPPPYMSNNVYFAVILAAALITFLIPGLFRRLAKPIVVFDAFGLGLFAILGTAKALNAGFGPVPSVLLGLVTAIGGGVIRDILRGEIPFVFTSELYALAALIGSAMYYILSITPRVPQPLAMIAGISATFILRLLAVRFRLRLPDGDINVRR